MAWSGSCSELEDDYDGGDYWDDPGTDLEDLPDEELIIELRDEQNSIKEAQRLIHKEIKSIRRELKHLLRYHAATPPQQEAVDQHVDSGVGESNYNTDYNTASEMASSYGDNEAGYQAFEYDTDVSAARYTHEERNRSHRFEDYDGRQEFNDDDHLRNGLSSYKYRERLTRREHEDGSPRGLGFGQKWEEGGNSSCPEEHAQGKKSTYEDAHGTVRGRHEVDSQGRNSESEGSGNRWKSIIKKHGKNMLSVPESDRGDSKMPHMSRKCAPDENSGDGGPDRASNESESMDLNHNVTRTQVPVVDVISKLTDTTLYKDTETTRPRLAGVKTTQATQHRLRSDNGNFAPYRGSQSAAIDRTDLKSQPSMRDARSKATNSGDESGRPINSSGRSHQSFSGITRQFEQPYLDQDTTRRLIQPKSSFGAISSPRSSSDESRYEMRTNVRENKTRGYRC